MQLLTFPYAFGTDGIYDGLTKELSNKIKVKNMNYPGHGKRVTENLMYSIEEIAKDAVSSIKDINEDYALLGYSMGAKVCCEILRQIEENSYPKPKHIFFVASEPPSNAVKMSKADNIDLQEARNILRKMGNTPKEVLESKELMEFFYPIIKADAKALESYYCPNWPLANDEVSVTIINGSGDAARTKEKAWKQYLSKSANYEFIRFNGSHFFLFENRENLSSVKDVVLNKLL